MNNLHNLTIENIEKNREYWVQILGNAAFSDKIVHRYVSLLSYAFSYADLLGVHRQDIKIKLLKHNFASYYYNDILFLQILEYSWNGLHMFCEEFTKIVERDTIENISHLGTMDEASFLAIQKKICESIEIVISRAV